jgi:hypothetical protein
MDTFRQELFIYMSETFSGVGAYCGLTPMALEDFLWDFVCPYGYKHGVWLEYIRKEKVLHVAASAEEKAQEIAQWRSSRFRRRPSPLRESFVPEEEEASEKKISMPCVLEDPMDVDLVPIDATHSKPLINWMWREVADEEEEEEDIVRTIDFRTPNSCPSPEKPRLIEDKEDMTRDVSRDVLENPFLVKLLDSANEASSKDACDDLSGDLSFAKPLLVDGCWREMLESDRDVEELVLMMSECVLVEDPEECWTPLNSDYEELVCDDEDDWDDVFKRENSKEEDEFWML